MLLSLLDEFMVFCPTTDLQASIYSSILDSDEIQDLVKSQDPCVCHSGKKRIECCQIVSMYVCVYVPNSRPFISTVGSMSVHLRPTNISV